MLYEGDMACLGAPGLAPTAAVETQQGSVSDGVWASCSPQDPKASLFQPTIFPLGKNLFLLISFDLSFLSLADLCPLGE